MHKLLQRTISNSIVVACLLSPSLLTAQDKVSQSTSVSKVRLDEVVVTATKTPIDVSKVPTNVSVVSKEDLEVKPNSSNAFDAIGNLANVNVIKSGGLNTINIRGMTPSVLVNGRDVNFLSVTLLSSAGLNSSSIDRIELIKGPQAAIHGSRAVSGVINVIKKKGDANNPYIELKGFGASGKRAGGNLTFSGGNSLDAGTLSYFFDISSDKQDKFKTPKGNIDFMDYDHKDVFARVDYAFDDHEIGFDYTYSDTQDRLRR
ncbi:TonB-dependent receptor [Campylobacter sp.]|uniref:TonB-dependent receptor n=1 Tax=Campylobacter sp. TaxID=205 RepID=UPI00270BB5B4|nr:TonB-dependent receptor plug domain-containing protein [Campylobacter sp.]